MTRSSIPWALVIFRLAAGPALTAMAVFMGPSAAREPAAVARAPAAMQLETSRDTAARRERHRSAIRTINSQLSVAEIHLWMDFYFAPLDLR